MLDKAGKDAERLGARDEIAPHREGRRPLDVCVVRRPHVGVELGLVRMLVELLIEDREVET